MSLCNIKTINQYYNTTELSPQRKENLILSLYPINISENIWNDTSQLANNVTLTTLNQIYITPTEIFKSYVDVIGTCNNTVTPPLDEITIEMWVKVVNFDGTIFFVSNRAGYHNVGYSFGKYLYGGNSLIFSIGYTTAYTNLLSSSMTWTIGNWYHIGVTYKSPLATFYINGVLHGTQSIPITSNIIQGSRNLEINTSTNYTSEMRIYNVALTPSEMSNNYINSATYHLLNSINIL